MPVLNGIDATNKIREFINSMNVPQPTIIGVTGHVQTCFKNQGLENGMDEVYGKPFYLKDLKNVINKYYYN